MFLEEGADGFHRNLLTGLAVLQKGAKM
jgi:hypothetical protein